MAYTEIPKESEWNSAQACAIRLDFELRKANWYSSSQNYFNWMQSLVNVYKEIWSKLKKDERTKLEGIRKKIRGEHNKIIYIRKRNHNKSMSSPAECRLLILLEKFEIYLRQYADDHGMLMPNKEDPSQAIYR